MRIIRKSKAVFADNKMRNKKELFELSRKLILCCYIFLLIISLIFVFIMIFFDITHLAFSIFRIVFVISLFFLSILYLFNGVYLKKMRVLSKYGYYPLRIISGNKAIVSGIGLALMFFGWGLALILLNKQIAVIFTIVGGILDFLVIFGLIK